MSQDYDPLAQRGSGDNAYDNLFARRIDALGGPPPAAPAPAPKKSAAGGGVAVYIVLAVGFGIFRAATSSSSRSTYAEPKFEPPKFDHFRPNEELMRWDADKDARLRDIANQRKPIDPELRIKVDKKLQGDGPDNPIPPDQRERIRELLRKDRRPTEPPMTP